MKKKFLILPVAVLGLLALSAAAFASGPRFSGNAYGVMNQMHEAMLSGDYNTWRADVNQLGYGQMMSGVNQANFSQMQQMHELMLQSFNQNYPVQQYPTNTYRGYGYGMMGF